VRRSGGCGAIALLLLGAAAPADPGGPHPARELRRRTIVIDERSQATVPEVHVAGGAATLLAFPTPVADGGAVLADPRGLFYPLAQTDRTVLVAPRADLAAPAALHVSLADGTVVAFQLTSVRGESDAQVDVVVAADARAAPDSSPALRRALEACREEADDLRRGSAQAGVRELAALLLAEGADGSRAFDRHPFHGGDRQDGLLVRASLAYRLVGLVLLLFQVENRDPARPWSLDRAEVRAGGTGEVADVHVLASAAEPTTLAPGEGGRAIVAFRAVPRAPGQPLTVTLREKDGSRHVVLDGLSP